MLSKVKAFVESTETLLNAGGYRTWKGAQDEPVEMLTWENPDGSLETLAVNKETGRGRLIGSEDHQTRHLLEFSLSEESEWELEQTSERQDVDDLLNRVRMIHEAAGHTVHSDPDDGGEKWMAWNAGDGIEVLILDLVEAMGRITSVKGSETELKLKFRVPPSQRSR